MEEYLIDNNVISRYFSQELSGEGMRLLSDVIDKTPNISIITQIEALSWKNKDIKKENIVKTFIEDSNILELTEIIANESIKIRRSKSIRTPDAIIAATAIVHNLTLLSSDADFKNIGRLKLLDPLNL